MQLEGKTVFITGGTGGLGSPLVAMLKKAGASVNAYDPDIDGDLIENMSQTCDALARETPDILINMAGLNAFGFAEDQDYRTIMELNLMAPMQLCQAVLPAMRHRGDGHIVNIGSMTGIIPLPHFTGYVTSKAGLKGFSDSLRRELDGSGITVTCIMPRAVKTQMNSGPLAEINHRTGVRHDPPEKIAERIFRAIIRREAEVRIGFPERLFAFLNAVFPRLIDSGLRKNRKIGEDLLGTADETPASRRKATA